MKAGKLESRLSKKLAGNDWSWVGRLWGALIRLLALLLRLLMEAFAVLCWIASRYRFSVERLMVFLGLAILGVAYLLWASF